MVLKLRGEKMKLTGNQNDFSDMFRRINDILINVQKGYIEPVEGTMEVFSIINMPVSTCAYCGEKYLPSKKQIISCCENIYCKKIMRRDRDRLRLEADPEIEREKSRLRQQRFREKKKQDVQKTAPLK